MCIEMSTFGNIDDVGFCEFCVDVAMGHTPNGTKMVGRNQKICILGNFGGMAKVGGGIFYGHAKVVLYSVAGLYLQDPWRCSNHLYYEML